MHSNWSHSWRICFFSFLNFGVSVVRSLAHCAFQVIFIPKWDPTWWLRVMCVFVVNIKFWLTTSLCVYVDGLRGLSVCAQNQQTVEQFDQYTLRSFIIIILLLRWDATRLAFCIKCVEHREEIEKTTGNRQNANEFIWKMWTRFARWCLLLVYANALLYTTQDSGYVWSFVAFVGIHSTIGDCCCCCCCM